MTRTLLIAALAVVLSGCGFTPQGDALRGFIANTGAKVADKNLETAEWDICQAASIGSVRRKYGQSAELAEAYNVLCEAGTASGIVTETEAGAEDAGGS